MTDEKKPPMRLLDRAEVFLLAQEQRPRTSHWPSKAGKRLDGGKRIGECTLAAWLSWMGQEPSNPSNLGGRMKQESGYGIEAIVAKWVAPVVPMAHQVPYKFTPDGFRWPVSGRVDSIYYDPEALGWVLISVKSTYGRGTRNIRREGLKPEWLLQENVNLYGLRHDFPCYVFDWIKWLVVSRDDGYMAELDVPVDYEAAEADFAQALKVWAYIEQALVEDKMPKPEYRDDEGDGKEWKDKPWGRWECRYCQHLDTCKALYPIGKEATDATPNE